MFDDGMTSLKNLLPLFDTGSGSFYDLRHFTLGVSPNIARWDYHATHVNQLYLLAGLDNDPILINTAKRWEGYMQGKRAAHNWTRLYAGDTCNDILLIDTWTSCSQIRIKTPLLINNQTRNRLYNIKLKVHNWLKSNLQSSVMKNWQMTEVVDVFK